VAPFPRRGEILKALGWPPSAWHRERVAADQRRKPGPKVKPVDPDLAELIAQVAIAHPWWGYRRIAVVCRRRGIARASNKVVYRVMKERKLLHRSPPRAPELHQATKLYELLPGKPNDLWQMDVTYIHIPGHGWWYAVTVIDYYSRYLLAVHLTASYSATDVAHGIDLARAEAERVHGPLAKPPFLVTDNGSCFLAHKFRNHIASAGYSHVRIRYRTPQQLGLLERFHQVLKEEEVYWRLYDNPGHCRTCLAEFHRRYNDIRPHWALIPEAGGDVVTPTDVYTGKVRTQLPRWQGWAREAKKKLDNLLQASA
jgi:putative transposase